MDSRLSEAKRYLDIVDNVDTNPIKAKREAYIGAAEQIAAYKADTSVPGVERSHTRIAIRMGRDEAYVRKLLKWRASGYEADTPFLMDKEATARAAKSHAKRVLGDMEYDDSLLMELPWAAKEKILEILAPKSEGAGGLGGVVRSIEIQLEKLVFNFDAIIELAKMMEIDDSEHIVKLDEALRNRADFMDTLATSKDSKGMIEKIEAFLSEASRDS